jgi:ketosteroid isomerase-like protein
MTRHMRIDIEVLEANEAFYRAFAGRDLPAMEAIWARAAPAACIHPGWDVLDGREEVLRSFRALLESGAAPRVRCTLAQAHLLGEVAYVTCHEVVDGARLAATNLFVREEGAWRICHHQASQIAPGQARARPPEPELRS